MAQTTTLMDVPGGPGPGKVRYDIDVVAFCYGENRGACS